jgi:pyruvate formate lyase activating enzyme
MNALQIAGRWAPVSELLEYAMEDKSFYEFSEGGITLGGGEVTAQPEAAVGLLMACKQHGVNTAIETCGYAKPEIIRKFAEYTDIFLYDVKGFDSDEHLANTGVRIERIFENLKGLLSSCANVKVRMPVLRGLNDSMDNIEGVCGFLAPYTDCKNFLGIDILPYHRLGENKYKQLNLTYGLEGTDPRMKDEDLARIEDRIRKFGINASIIRH